MARPPAPDIEDLHQVILIHIPCKDDIIKACADYGRRDDRYGDGQYKVLLDAEFWGSYISDGDSQQEPSSDQYAVPHYIDSEYGKSNRIR